MRLGSYTQIEKGMRVEGPDEETIGAVDEVIVDDGAGIFVGLAVRPNLFTHPLFVRGEVIDRLEDGVVYIGSTSEELRPYNTPLERHHDTEEANAAV